MSEPKAMIATTKQPIGWPTHKYQHCLKTVLPSTSTGTNMKLHHNIPKELLPNAPYRKLAGRWRSSFLPPLTNGWHPTEQTRHSFANDYELEQRRNSNTRSAHYEVRPPSAYSDSIILKPSPKHSAWVRNSQLDTGKLKGMMRENTFHPGNFSTLYKCNKEKVGEMVNRLSYDPYERREQFMLADNPEGSGDPLLYSKADVDAIVRRLATTRAQPEASPEPEKKAPGKELSPKEKEIVDRLSKYEHPADKVTEGETEKKTVTEAQLQEMLKRLTQNQERRLPLVQQKENKKVSMVDMETILTRLTTYDAQKWPPESKPEIFKQHARQD